MWRLHQRASEDSAAGVDKATHTGFYLKMADYDKVNELEIFHRQRL